MLGLALLAAAGLLAACIAIDHSDSGAPLLLALAVVMLLAFMAGVLLGPTL